MGIRILLFSIFYFLVASITAQENSKIDFFLRNRIKTSINKGETVRLFVKGDREALLFVSSQLGGRVNYSFLDYTVVSLPLNKVEAFARHSAVKKIEYDKAKPELLNDTMLVNNSVIPAHQGTAPLLQNYDGSGSVVGIIDSGIDITHPDFQDTLGNTRILHIWDQRKPYDPVLTPPLYGYGQEFDSTDINNGTSTHSDPSSSPWWGHGTNVSGAAVGNGNAIGKYAGVAKNADIIVVGTNLNASNWRMTVAEGVDYIFRKADSLGKPCAINISLGTYWGAHDGKDAAALFIDSLLDAKSGRAVIAAAGNAGHVNPFHLRSEVNNDTSFTWFTYNPSSALGYGSVFFEAWADTADFNNVEFAVGADKVTPDFSFRGSTPFDNISNRLGMLVTDTLKNDTNVLAIVDTWAVEENGRYKIQVHLAQPDSSQYYYRFIIAGTGSYDTWSSAVSHGTSNMIYNGLPDSTTFPEIVNYQKPDSLQSIVDSWNCSPKVISVGNYTNRHSYLDYNNVVRYSPDPPGKIFHSSSRGPSRLGIMKPDILASGDQTMTTGQWKVISDALAGGNDTIVDPGGYHHIKGGTSMASPVVTGIAALMFQHCPYASWQDIKQAMTASAKQDSFTGTVPNYHAGFGKADGFAAMNYFAFPATLNVSGPVAICEFDSVELTPVGSFTSALWSNGDTNTTISVSQTGNFYATVSDSLGCPSRTDTLQLTVNSLPAPSVNPDTIAGCIGDSIRLTVDTGYVSYIWSNGDTNPVTYVHQTNPYFFLATDSNGCQGYSDTVNITMHDLPQSMIIASGPLAFCQGDSTSLYIDEYSFIQWNTGSNDSMITVNSSGDYFAYVEDTNSCANYSDTVEITVHPNPNPTIVANGSLTFCDGDSVALYLNNSFNSVSWSNGSGAPQIQVSLTGTYSAEVVDGEGCQGYSDTVETIVHPLPSPPVITQSGDTLATGSASAYQWYKEGRVIFGATDSFYVVTGTAGFYVMITDSNGCVAVSDTIFTGPSGIITDSVRGWAVVYPNPFADKIYVKSKELDLPVNLRIVNTVGELVRQLNVTEEMEVEIDLREAASGVYFLQFRSGEKVFIRKVIKE